MLQGIKVVEYATYMAAPGAGCILADWGAEVIKIEPPKGDPIRQFFATIGTDIADNPVFDFDNRGKKSIVVDTSKPEGVDIVKKLVADADVFLTNVRPGGLERSGLDYDSLKELNPGLVYCTLTGYGLEGPDKDRPGFDIASFWSRAGLARLFPPKGMEPFPLRTAFGDHVTSIAASSAINAALVQKFRTGKGQLVEASLLRAGLYSVGSDLAIQLFFDRVASTKDRYETNVPIMNFFKSKDEKWLCIVARQGNADWPKICKAAGIPEMADDERLKSGKGRRANSREVVERLETALEAYDMDEIAKRLDEEQIAWAPVQSLADVAQDPQVYAAGGILEMPSRSGGTFKTPGAPARFPGTEDGPSGPAPAMGEHTRETLTALGISEAEIDALYESEIVK
ncbi:CaiB/BaiF CoA-transferase family protein [Ponticaulis sp.]|uniref:CaiB/BaiF CoA transferase family protein n=1 Tax=Ponticaulis sp. TaxID=2020902 RepID=UPI000B6B1D59|nr:CaiB/BaiF CoA-transferase family protein [Ponticaulis sp.]MAI91930.1 CoA transferase [Ponticaulis sp.]OUX96405.1 MAG: CoA transferase [Hyphomonadaceae bacterium TMED5]|tara:strand:- start:7660 stop:8853 length:1194 start_codon:yes stop_codon:yes gene_type:complete